MKFRSRANGAFSFAAILSLLTACGGGSPAPAPGPNPGPNPTPTTFTIGGTASGLNGTVVLQNSGGNNLSLTTNGAFTFSTAVANGAAYSVTVLSQPSGQTCVVSNGGGNVSSANVTTVALTCTTNTYTIGGTVSGLGAGKNVVLQNNGAGSVNVTANGAFTFTNSLATGANYNATIVSQPSGQVCSIAGGSGTVANANAATVAVTCTNVASGGFTLGGTVSGLGVGKSLMLRGLGDGLNVTLTVTSNGPFTLPASFSNQAEYLLVIETQPIDQLCKATPDEGDVNGANVTNIAIACQSKAVGAKNWGTPGTLSSRSQIEFLPKVAMSSNGDGMAVWESIRVTGIAHDVYYSHYTPSTGWSAPDIIARLSPQDPFGDNSRNPDVAMDSNGNAIAVWNGPATGQGFDVWASRFTPGGGWSQREMIHSAHPDFQDGRSPIRIAFDGNGNAIAAWVGAFGIQFNRYTVGVGWATPPDHGMISVLGSSIDSDPGLGVNASGEAIVVWQQHSGLAGERRLWSSRYSVGTNTWGAPQLADSVAGAHPAGENNVVLDANGNATASWTHSDGSRLHILANRQVGGVWGTPTQLETTFAGTPEVGLSSAYDSRIAIDGNGAVFVMWRQQLDTTQGFMRARRFVSGIGWQDPITLGNYVPLFSHITDTSYDVEANAAGNAVFVWVLTPGELEENVPMPADVWSNQYVAGGGWSIPEIMGGLGVPGNTANAKTVSVGIDSGGNALAVWDGASTTQGDDMFFNRMQ